MRILLTGIPSYLQRTVSRVSGATVHHKPYFDDIRSKKELIDQVKKIANTGNYLIGEGAAYALRGHDVTYVPFWHLVNSRGANDVYDALNKEFDMCVFASANLLRPGYSADLEADVFDKLKMPVLVMGIGIQKREGLKENLPAGTLRFLEVLKQKESFFLTRGYFTAEFLRAEGMKFVKPTGCPSLFFAPNEMRRSLTSLANADLASAQKLALGGYLGSVADTIVDAHALLKPDSVASYVIQDEVVAYNLTLPVDDNAPVYDRSSGRITGKTEYKHQEKWQRENELHGVLRHQPVARLVVVERPLHRPAVPWLRHRHAGGYAVVDDCRRRPHAGDARIHRLPLYRGGRVEPRKRQARPSRQLPVQDRCTGRHRAVLGLRGELPKCAQTGWHLIAS